MPGEGRDDFQFPSEHQATLADQLPNACLEMIERAGQNAPTEQSVEVIQAVRDFMAATNVPKAAFLAVIPGTTFGIVFLVSGVGQRREVLGRVGDVGVTP